MIEKIKIIWILICAALLLLLIGGCTTQKAETIGQPAVTDTAGPFTSAIMLEERYGIRIMLIGVTGGGGLIDFRFRILDLGKARQIVGPSKIPELVAVERGIRLAATKNMTRSIRMQNGEVSFLFYPNVRSAVKPGTMVSAVFGHIRVEPINAQ